MQKIVLIAAVVGLSFSACTKETPDLTKPLIVVTEPDALYMDVALGQTYTISATITDDVALSQWKMEIHNADGHTHRIMAGEWEMTETGSATDKSYTLNKTISVPADAEIGEYHLTFDATDAAGNTAIPVIIELHVE